MLDEVRRPELVVVLENRPGVDDQPQLGAALRTCVPPDEVRQPVREPPFADLVRQGNRGGRVRLRGRGLERGRTEQQGDDEGTETLGHCEGMS